MIVEDSDVRRPEKKGPRQTSGWTSLHSWVFLAIVAAGLLVIAVQNRYHYLSPLGLGKAYRIDKVFGGIQEFDASGGWIKAQLQAQPPMSMLQAPGGPQMGAQPAPSLAPSMPGGMPGMLGPSPAISERMVPGAEALDKESPPAIGSPKETAPPTAAPAAARPKEESKEERLKAFQKHFPDFGAEEFQLANDDLYPHWKQSVAPNGTWNDFLVAYGEFIEWWNDKGSPPEPGFKLWKDFVAARGR